MMIKSPVRQKDITVNQYTANNRAQNKNENTMYQNLWDAAKVHVEVNFRPSLKVYMRKGKK